MQIKTFNLFLIDPIVYWICVLELSMLILMKIKNVFQLKLIFSPSSASNIPVWCCVYTCAVRDTTEHMRAVVKIDTENVIKRYIEMNKREVGESKSLVRKKNCNFVLPPVVILWKLYEFICLLIEIMSIIFKMWNNALFRQKKRTSIQEIKEKLFS